MPIPRKTLRDLFLTESHRKVKVVRRDGSVAVRYKKATMPRPGLTAMELRFLAYNLKDHHRRP